MIELASLCINVSLCILYIMHNSLSCTWVCSVLNINRRFCMFNALDALDGTRNYCIEGVKRAVDESCGRDVLFDVFEGGNLEI